MICNAANIGLEFEINVIKSDSLYFFKIIKCRLLIKSEIKRMRQAINIK